MASKRTGSGQLRERVTFQRPITSEDQYGVPIPGGGGWEDVFTCAARLQPKFGTNTETFAASRLASKQPYNLTVRACAATRAVRTDWRVVDARTAEDQNGATPRCFNIATIVDPLEDGAWLELLVVEGEAS